MKNILVTGGFGNFGKSIDVSDFGDFVLTKYNHVALDLTDYKSVGEVIAKKKPEIIIHLASLVGKEANDNPKEAFNVNVRATKNLLMVAQDYGLRKFIFTSSCSIYDQKELKPTKESQNIKPHDWYSETKLKAERVLRGNAVCQLIIFRVFNPYGEHFKQTLIGRAIRGERVEIFKDCYRDYISIRDISKVFGLAVRNYHTGTYNLGTGFARTSEEVVRELEAKGYKCLYDVRNKKPSYSLADITKLKRDFNFEPDTQLRW